LFFSRIKYDDGDDNDNDDEDDDDNNNNSSAAATLHFLLKHVFWQSHAKFRPQGQNMQLLTSLPVHIIYLLVCISIRTSRKKY
jgi:hypothetical protein